MAESKPQFATEYDSQTTVLIVRTSLHLATVLGDFKDDVVMVGGMAPYFLIDQSKQPYEQQHIGSRDVDVALSIALLEEERYEAIADRLRSAGFEPGANEKGNPTRQSWRHSLHQKAVVEFLMDADGEASKLQNLTGELAAMIMPGIRLAFRDWMSIRLSGRTLDDAVAERDFYVCGPGAFVMTKALAFHDRSFGKDAYDLYYVARNFGSGPNDIADHIRPLLDDEKASEGLEIIQENFASLNHNGPVKLAQFLARENDDDLRADVSGTIMEIVRLCR
jgi:hypothetical protein